MKSKRGGTARAYLHASLLFAGLIVAFPAAAPANTAPGNFAACAFEPGQKSSALEPGAGGDTVSVGDNARVAFYWLADSASPVTLEQHDVLVLPGADPAGLQSKRLGNSLVLCLPAMQVEIAIEHQFCRSPTLSRLDTANHEFEELRFPEHAEVWLTDVLFAAYLEAPDRFLHLIDAAQQSPSNQHRAWRVRPFSEVLPTLADPARGCP